MDCLHAYPGSQKKPPPARWRVASAPPEKPNTNTGLLLPGAFLVAIGAQLFAAFMFVDLAFAAFL
jgi:hypothetical protein